MNLDLWWEVEQTRIIIGIVSFLVFLALYLVFKGLEKISSPLFRKEKKY